MLELPCFYETVALQVAGANRRWRGQFRCRGSRRESAVAQLFSLGVIRTTHESTATTCTMVCNSRDVRVASANFS